MANHFSVCARKSLSSIDLNALSSPAAVEIAPGTHRMWAPSAKIWVTCFSDLPMLDWDWPDAAHVGACVTISKPEGVIEVLEPWCAHHDQSCRLYQTVGGLRGFFLAHRATPAQFFEKYHDWLELNPDPLYARLALEVNAFRVRTSPKPKRLGDYVARYLTTIGNNVDRDLLSDVIWYHDGLIPM